jgi:hypothetical protein
MKDTTEVKAIVALTLAVMIIGAAPKRGAGPPADPHAAIFARARTAVMDSLKDPDSAKFKPFTLVTDADGNKKVCGQVNAKNAYGGYVGFTGFAYTLELGDLIFAPNPDDNDFNERNHRGSGCLGFGSWHR